MMGELKYAAVFIIGLKILFCDSLPMRDVHDAAVEFLIDQSHRASLHRYRLNEAYSTVFQSEDAFSYLHSCPTDVKSGANLPTNEVSTCPWYYQVIRDPNRHPEVILNAVTPCNNGCIGRGDDFQCSPIERTIEVLQFKGNFNGTYRIYEPEEIAIAVGFTCASRNVAPTLDNRKASAITRAENTTVSTKVD